MSEETAITNITYNHFKLKQSELRYWLDNPEHFNLELFIYDEKKNLIKYQYLSEEGCDYSHIYIYKNNLIQKCISHRPKVWAVYDKKEGSFYEKNDLVGTSFVSSKNYYKNGMVYKKHFYSGPDYDGPTKLREKEFIKYDSNKNVIEIKKIPIGSNMTFISKFKFNEKNKVIFESNETIGFDSDSDYEKYYSYKGSELSSLIIKNKTSAYDIEFNYKYDDFWNWIEKTKSVNGKKLFIWKREIDYYSN